MSTPEQVSVFFTPKQIIVLNRMFNVIDEKMLRAHCFTKEDIENVYGCLSEIREGVDEAELLLECESE